MDRLQLTPWRENFREAAAMPAPAGTPGEGAMFSRNHWATEPNPHSVLVGGQRGLGPLNSTQEARSRVRTRDSRVPSVLSRTGKL